MKNTKLMSIGRTTVVGSVFLFGCIWLAGCGDETTKVTETVGLSTVDEGEDMPECTKENDGRMVYVVDSATSFVCADKQWHSQRGESGASCTAKALKDQSGFDLICDGKKVATLKDGVNGEGGNSGATCSAKALKDKSGFDLICDGKKVGTIKNGAKGDEGSSCEGKVEKDGSITIKCDGEKVGTLKNGENGDASSCTASQNKAKDGYDIVCGGTKIASVKNGKDGKSAFELAQEIDGTFADEAAWLESLKNSVGCTFEEDDLYLSITCGKDPSVKILKALCAGKLYDPEKYFCYADKPYPRCGKIATETENNWTSIPSNALATGGTYDAKTYFCAANNLLYQRCGSKGAYDPMRKFCSDQSLLDLCGGKNYDPDKAFCDTRGKGTVYSTALINGRLWMTENLNYQPDDAKEGEIFCKDSTAADGKCGTKGRLYTFAAAEKYCPSGWVLPTYDDWKSLQTSYPNRASLESSDFKPQYGGVCTPELNCYNVGVTGNYWSQTPSTAESNVWVFSYSTNSSNVNISNSYTSDGYGASVRCRHRYVMPQSEQE